MAWRYGSAPLTAGLIALVVLGAAVVLGPALRPHPDAVNIDHGLSASGSPLPPSWSAPLGTDELGRDVAARVSAGLGTSLITALLATALALTIGVTFGLLGGLARRGTRWLDSLLGRAVDVALALPSLLLVILAAAAVRAAAADGAPPTPTTSVVTTALVLGLLGWPVVARVVHARAAVLARSEMVLAARALGAGTAGVLWRHILPNLRGVVLALATIVMALILLADATLSFVGLGAPPPMATLGRMVFEGRVYFRTAPWLLFAPGLAIVLAVGTFQVLSASLRQRLEGGE